MRPGEIEDDADPGCHKDQEAYHLDKNVDQDAGDRHICGYAELRKQPCADDVAADADERNQRINRFAHEAQAGENVRATLGRCEQAPPANPGRRQRHRSGDNDERRAPLRADKSLQNRGEAEISNQSGQQH